MEGQPQLETDYEHRTQLMCRPSIDTERTSCSWMSSLLVDASCPLNPRLVRTDQSVSRLDYIQGDRAWL